MSTSIERRVAALEQAIGPEKEPTLLVIRFVAPGGLDAEARRATIDGRTLLREAGEGKEEFCERVKREARQHFGERFGVVLMHSNEAPS